MGKYKYELRKISLEEGMEIIDNVPEGKTQLRNKALIAITMIFGKRAIENLSLRKLNVWTSEGFLYVSFKVVKKMRRAKTCVQCGERVPLKGIMCPYCGNEEFNIRMKGEPFVERVKHKDLKHPMVKVFLDWFDKVPEDSYIFPPLKTRGNIRLSLLGLYEWNWHSHLSYVRMWQIFKEVSDISPHGARHSLASKLAETGEYDEMDLLFWFDWTSFDSARRYIKKGGGKRVRKVAEYMG